jgi:hypothetical protein
VAHNKRKNRHDAAAVHRDNSHRFSLKGKERNIFFGGMVKNNLVIFTLCDYCFLNLVVGRKILWYFQLKILRGL